MGLERVEPALEDLSREEPLREIEDTVPLAVDADRLEQFAVPLSRVLLDYPALYSSSVIASGRIGNGYLVNTEGTRVRLGAGECNILLSASTQADDGMRFAINAAIAAEAPTDLPSLEDAERQARAILDLSLPGAVEQVAEPGQTLPNPALTGKSAVGGQPTAYACLGPQCSLPVTPPAALVELLRKQRMV